MLRSSAKPLRCNGFSWCFCKADIAGFWIFDLAFLFTSGIIPSSLHPFYFGVFASEGCVFWVNGLVCQAELEKDKKEFNVAKKASLSGSNGWRSELATFCDFCFFFWLKIAPTWGRYGKISHYLLLNHVKVG